MLLQLAIVVVTGGLAYLAARAVRPALTGAVEGSANAVWAQRLAHIADRLSFAVLWLLLLVASQAISYFTGADFGWVHAAISLVLAWIVIRLLSEAVTRSFWSNAIALIVWAIAALSILDLLDPLMQHLDASAVTLGGLRISALTVLSALLILAALLWLTTVFSSFLERRIAQAHALTPTLQVLLIQVLRVLLPIIAVVVALMLVGVDLTAFAVFSGAIGIGIGLGLQRTAANFVGGLSLIIGQSIKPGDVIAYGGGYGWVTDMGARYVTLRTRDDITHLIPNDFFITNGVENWSQIQGQVRLHIRLGITYESDVPKSIALCLEVMSAQPRVLTAPAPVCLVKAFTPDAIELDLRLWINDPKAGVSNIKSAVMLEILRRFGENGIAFAAPRRTIHLSSPPAPA
ncbi:MAG TPA: mechanosensitive ion channel domain-containing protein [Rhizomicrobium sp.]|nr:mechanosensitive ion channel domain-containing protein [Rhizomicrobium sp.]